MALVNGHRATQCSLKECHELVGPAYDVAARFARVDHHVVGEHLPHPVPVLGVHGAEIAGLEAPDLLDFVHVGHRSLAAAGTRPRGKIRGRSV